MNKERVQELLVNNFRAQIAVEDMNDTPEKAIIVNLLKQADIYLEVMKLQIDIIGNHEEIERNHMAMIAALQSQLDDR